MVSKLLLVLAVCIPGWLGLMASDLPPRPEPARLVNDFAGVLSDARVALLEHKLDTFARSTSTQIAVVVVSSLGDYPPEEFAQRLMDAWGVGQKGKNNGVLILVKPKVKGTDRGQVAISMGYGLEGLYPTAWQRESSNTICSPRFAQEITVRGLTGQWIF
jgi:uncharacterized protein